MYRYVQLHSVMKSEYFHLCSDMNHGWRLRQNDTDCLALVLLMDNSFADGLSYFWALTKTIPKQHTFVLVCLHSR
mgnify:CR=1 FL=1